MPHAHAATCLHAQTHATWFPKSCDLRCVPSHDPAERGPVVVGHIMWPPTHYVALYKPTPALLATIVALSYEYNKHLMAHTIPRYISNGVQIPPAPSIVSVPCSDAHLLLVYLPHHVDSHVSRSNNQKTTAVDLLGSGCCGSRIPQSGWRQKTQHPTCQHACVCVLCVVWGLGGLCVVCIGLIRNDSSIYLCMYRSVCVLYICASHLHTFYIHSTYKTVPSITTH